MKRATKFVRQPEFDGIPADFWKQLISNPQLQGCSNLEKLLKGCEIIAALNETEIPRAA